jgi:hypothetical protein
LEGEKYMRERRKIKIKVVDDASQYSNITNEQLLADSEKYDKENYNPLDNIEDKEVFIPKLRRNI